MALKNNLRKNFGLSFILSGFGLLLSGYLGYLENPDGSMILQFVFLTLVLALLEITISFDNALVDATVLKKMTPQWQKRFLTWGIFIAVFGMRLIFPIAIVSIASSQSPLEAIHLAVFEQKKYMEVMLSIRHELAAFGGTFLALVSLSYFFNHEKDVHWVSFIEKRLTKLGALKSTEIGVMLVILWLFSGTLEGPEAYSVFKAGIAGVFVFILVKLLGEFLNLSDGNKKNLHRQSLGLFLYLEMLDASFSFDGVIAAFAITINPFLIAIGLGIGALFVRSFTISIVEKGSLQTFQYLENGAFWAIGLLSLMMFVGIHHEIPELVTGGAGLVVIGASFFHSLYNMKKERS
jgi:uncharacterized protein